MPSCCDRGNNPHIIRWWLPGGHRIGSGRYRTWRSALVTIRLRNSQPAQRRSAAAICTPRHYTRGALAMTVRA